jgi:succinate dehydrogenase flavin-adding protein (antitoxin of CptAB toxin-antitoxin module)
MPEWVLKFVTAIPTAKTAFKLLLTVLLIVLGWSIATSFLKEKGIPNEMIPFLLTLMSFSIAVIVLESFYKVYGAICKWAKYWINIYSQKKEQARQLELANITKYKEATEFRNKVALTFPYLDQASQRLLIRLFKSVNEALEWLIHPTIELHREGFIKQIGKASYQRGIYELDPIVREYLTQYLSEKKEKNLTVFSKELDDNSKQFLRIFFDELVPFGILEQEIWMERRAYNSRHEMLRIEAIEQIDYTFILSSDFKEHLIRDGHFKNCYRTEVTLEPSCIHA